MQEDSLSENSYDREARIFLRFILFREDISSISVYGESYENIDIAYRVILLNIYKYHPVFLLLVLFHILQYNRAVIEPFLYTYCICVYLLCTMYPHLDLHIT